MVISLFEILKIALSLESSCLHPQPGKGAIITLLVVVASVNGSTSVALVALVADARDVLREIATACRNVV